MIKDILNKEFYISNNTILLIIGILIIISIVYAILFPVKQIEQKPEDTSNKNIQYINKEKEFYDKYVPDDVKRHMMDFIDKATKYNESKIEEQESINKIESSFDGKTLKLKGNATVAYGNPDASKVYNPISPPIQIEYQTFEEINRQYTQPYVQNNNYGENHRTAYEMQRIDPAPPGQQWINGYRNKYGTWVNPYLRSVR